MMGRGTGPAAAACAAIALAISAPARAQTMEELYAQGVEARQEQRFDAAADLLARALALKPDNADALVQLGFTRLGQGDLPAAREAFSHALALAPDYADASFGLAQIEFRSGKPAAALAIAEPLAQAHPGNGEFAGLLDNIRKALAAEPAPTARTAAQDTPARTKARRQPRRPDAVATLLEQGRKQREAGDFAQAEHSYRKALALAPRNADVLTALGLVAGFQQKYVEAGRFFETALAIRPDNLDARLGQVRLALWQGDRARARTLVGDLRARAPDNPEALLLDARIALLEQDYPRADGLFRQVAARDPRNAEALVGLGDLRRAQGDDARAREAWHRALALEPGSADVRDRLAAPPPRKWRLDIDGEASDLTAGLGTWTDSSVRLSYQLAPQTRIGVMGRRASRHGQADFQVEARVDHDFSPELSAYGLIAATAQADFLARFSLGAGATWRAVPAGAGLGPVLVSLDVRHDRFAAADILTLSPEIQGYVLDGRLALSARWVHARDDHGTDADGHVLRADAVLTPRLSVFAGYADAPEITDGTLVDTRAVFAGTAFALSEDLTLRASFAHERRPDFDRDTFGLGIAMRF